MKTKDKRLIILTIAFILVALAAMVVFNFVSFNKSMKDNLELIGEHSLGAEANEVETYLGRASNTLQVSSMTVEYMLRQNKSPAEIELYLKDQTKEFMEQIDENFTGVYGYINETYIDGSDWIPDEDYEPTTREWYTEAAKAGGKVVIASPYLDAMTGDIIVSVCRLLSDGKSVLSIDVTLNEVQNITEKISLNDLGYGFIFDSTGMIISHSNKEQVGKNIKDINQKLFDMSELQDKFPMEIDGETDYVFTQKTAENWTVVMIVSRSRLFKPVSDLLMRSIIIVIIVYIVVVLFSMFSLRKLEDSIRKLDQKQEEVQIANANLIRSNKTISTLAYKDIITDLKNRYALQDELGSKYSGHKLEFVYIDINNFNQINKSYGYEVGDEILYAISNRIKKQTSGTAEIYSIFSDAFCLVFDAETSKLSDFETEQLINRISNELSDEYMVGTQPIRIDVSTARYTSESDESINFSKLVKKMQKAIEGQRNGI